MSPSRCEPVGWVGDTAAAPLVAAPRRHYTNSFLVPKIEQAHTHAHTLPKFIVGGGLAWLA